MRAPGMVFHALSGRRQKPLHLGSHRRHVAQFLSLHAGMTLLAGAPGHGPSIGIIAPHEFLWYVVCAADGAVPSAGAQQSDSRRAARLGLVGEPQLRYRQTAAWLAGMV